MILRATPMIPADLGQINPNVLAPQHYVKAGSPQDEQFGDLLQLQEVH